MPPVSTNPASIEQSSRDKILDAAEGLFAKRGYAGIGLREVAEVVGLGKSSLFHHFKNKPELYAAVVGRILARIEERLLRSLAAGGDPIARLERWIDDLVDMLAENPTWARLLLRSLFEDDDLPGNTREELVANQVTARIFASAGALLREGMSVGLLRAANVQHLLLTLVGMMVFPFASGEFGTTIVGKDLFDPAEVRRRKKDLRDLLRFGLLSQRER